MNAVCNRDCNKDTWKNKSKCINFNRKKPNQSKGNRQGCKNNEHWDKDSIKSSKAKKQIENHKKKEHWHQVC